MNIVGKIILHGDKLCLGCPQDFHNIELYFFHLVKSYVHVVEFIERLI